MKLNAGLSLRTRPMGNIEGTCLISEPRVLLRHGLLETAGKCKSERYANSLAQRWACHRCSDLEEQE
jgi:hypothetical protein